MAQASTPAACAGATGNCSVVASSGTNNSTSVDQSGGTGNVSDVEQDGENLTATVTQGADAIISNVGQETIALNHQGIVATVTQAGGADSIVSQNSSGDDFNNMTATVDQNGASASDIAQKSINNNGTSNINAVVN